MYTERETILIKLLLKRLITKRFRIPAQTKEFVSLMIGMEKYTSSFNKDQFLMVIIMFPHEVNFFTTFNDLVREDIKRIGKIYGLDVGCSVWCLSSSPAQQESEKTYFKTRYDYVFIHPNERVKHV